MTHEEWLKKIKVHEAKAVTAEEEEPAPAPLTIVYNDNRVIYNIIQTAISNGNAMPAPRINLIDAPQQSYAEKLGAAYQADPNYGKRPMEDWEHKMLKSQSSWGG
jgi:hypothetical protein